MTGLFILFFYVKKFTSMLWLFIMFFKNFELLFESPWFYAGPCIIPAIKIIIFAIKINSFCIRFICRFFVLAVIVFFIPSANERLKILFAWYCADKLYSREIYLFFLFYEIYFLFFKRFRFYSCSINDCKFVLKTLLE